MTDFRETHAPPCDMRDDYLVSLPEAQEWFLEELVLKGDVWESRDEAYAVFRNGTLVEFHAHVAVDALSCLRDLKSRRPFDAVLCKSFDHRLLDAAEALGGTTHEAAFLFRNRRRVHLAAPAGFRMIPATLRDLDEAHATGPDFFASRQEVEDLWQSGRLHVAWYNSEIAGCGTMYPIEGPFNAVDVGMVVRPDLRGQGFGAAIVHSLAASVDELGKKPVCGCAKDNVASRKALERAGFVARHRLLRIMFQD